MYGSINGVKDNLPRFEKYILPDNQVSDEFDIKESTITGYLDEFTSQVDAAIAGQYVLPLPEGNVPAVIHSVVNNLAAYKLARRFWTTIGAEENVQISSLRKDAKEILDSIESGTYILPGVERITVGTSVNELDQLLTQYNREEIFTMEDPASWQDKL
jgi:phage gp36-like protein